LLSNDVHAANHFCLAQAGVIHVSQPTSQLADCRRPFLSTHGLCSKICSSKRLLERFEDFAIR